MYSCYILSLLSLGMLFLTGTQGYFHFHIFNANHSAFALLTVIIYLFTQTLVIFYFVGIGISIKDYTALQKSAPLYHKRSLAIKRWMYPPLLLNMLFVMVLFISGGALHTRMIPAWSHGLLFLVSILDYARVLLIEHKAFKESTEIVLEMSGIPARQA